jgi:hypothetical protein
MLFLHGVRDTLQRQGKKKAFPRTQKGGDIQEWASGETGRHHWNKQPIFRTAATSEEREDNRQRQETGATSGKQVFRNTIELEIAKQIVGTSIRLRKMSVATLWKGHPPPKRKKRTA